MGFPYTFHEPAVLSYLPDLPAEVTLVELGVVALALATLFPPISPQKAYHLIGMLATGGVILLLVSFEERPEPLAASDELTTELV